MVSRLFSLITASNANLVASLPVKGIFVTFTNDPPNPKITNWNVTELKVDPVKRHIDKSVVNDFWRNLEAWISTHKNGVVDW